MITHRTVPEIKLALSISPTPKYQFFIDFYPLSKELVEEVSPVRLVESVAGGVARIVILSQCLKAADFTSGRLSAHEAAGTIFCYGLSEKSLGQKLKELFSASKSTAVVVDAVSAKRLRQEELVDLLQVLEDTKGDLDEVTLLYPQEWHEQLLSAPSIQEAKSVSDAENAEDARREAKEDAQCAAHVAAFVADVPYSARVAFACTALQSLMGQGRAPDQGMCDQAVGIADMMLRAMARSAASDVVA